MNNISIFGTSSDAGKSTITFVIAKILQDLGYSVAPFKAQNVSNNSHVCDDGSEIAIAQYFQAEVLGVETSYHLNPPFNQSEWGADILAEDGRWKYGTPPNGNANFAWMQHMIYHLATNGVMATVLSNGSLSSTNSGEGLIREKIVKDNLVECIIALPKQLFYNTGIPATIWILRRGRDPKDNQTLFIDASELGYMKTRVIRDFTDKEIAKIEETYKKWRNKDGYEDIAGFCKSASLEDIAGHDFVLTPGRYVGIVHEEDDDVSFEEKMEYLTSALSKQMEQEKILDDEIKEQLLKIGYSL